MVDDSPKRLLNGGGDGQGFALSLLHAAQPISPDLRRKQKNWAALQNKMNTRRAWFLRPVIVGVSILTVTGAVAATFGVRLLAVREVTPPQRSANVVVQAPLHHQEPVPSEIEPNPSPPVAAPAVVASPKRTFHAQRAAHAELVRKADADSEVLAAIRLLRAGKDPQLASPLAEMYLQRHPHGQLAEEALAVLSRSYETRQPAKAKRFAQLYLKRFPRGAYVASMQRLVELQP